MVSSFNILIGGWVQLTCLSDVAVGLSAGIVLDGSFDNEAVVEPTPWRRPRRVWRDVKGRCAEWRLTAASAAAARGLRSRILKAAKAKSKISFPRLFSEWVECHSAGWTARVARRTLRGARRAPRARRVVRGPGGGATVLVRVRTPLTTHTPTPEPKICLTPTILGSTHSTCPAPLCPRQTHLQCLDMHHGRSPREGCGESDTEQRL